MKDILIIDHNELKREYIKKVLTEVYEDVAFFDAESFDQALYLLFKKRDLIDLVILDWNIPMTDNELVISGLGRKVLDEMKKLDIDIDTIVCSFDMLKLDNDYNNVKAIIKYPSHTLETYQKGLLSEYISSDLVEDDEKELKKKRNIWKRKRSSDPWWR